MTQLEALHNAVRSTAVMGLKVYEKYSEDKRKTVKKYFLELGNETISPTLNYDNMNHFIWGYSKGIKSNMKQSQDVLPPIELYSHYLGMAHRHFNIPIDQARNKYGQFTINEWHNLFQANPTQF